MYSYLYFERLILIFIDLNSIKHSNPSLKDNSTNHTINFEEYYYSINYNKIPNYLLKSLAIDK